MNIGEKLNQVKVSQLMLKLPVIALSVLTHTAAMAQSSSTSTSKAAAGTSTVTAEATKPESANKFGFVYANAMNQSIYNTRKVGGAATVNVFSASYKYSDTWKYAFTMTNDYNIPARGEVDNKYAVYRDAIFSGATTYGSLLGTEKTPVKYSVYLPTTTASKDVKQYLVTRADITLGYDITDKLSATSIFAPMVYVRNGPDQLRHYLWSELRYSYTPAFSNFIYLEHDVRGMSDKSVEKSKEGASLGLGVGYSPNKIVDLTLAVSRDRALSVSNAENESIKKDPDAEFAFLDEREISYTTELVVKF